MSIEFYGWEVVYEDKGHLKSGQDLQNGRGYTMYHGTHKNNAADIVRSGFKPSTDGLLGPGVYVSRDMNKARAYPKQAGDHDKVVFKLKVRVGKVKKIDTDNHPFQKTWHQQGYDCAWVPPKCGMMFIPSGKEEDCVWDPKRITVVDIAYANDLVKKDLRKLIRQQTVAKEANVKDQCDICGYRKYSSHVIQKCWGCGKVVCPFMNKHVCKKGFHTRRNYKCDTNASTRNPSLKSYRILKLKVKYCRAVQSLNGAYSLKGIHFNSSVLHPLTQFKSSRTLCDSAAWSRGEMALIYFGWETIYDNNHHLQSNQEPMNGTEYTMYHGTSVSNALSIIQYGFKQSSKGMLGPGVYVSRDKEKAKRYPINSPNDRVILMLKVRVGKVKKIDQENHPMSKTWNQQGYDTAWVPPNCGMRNVPSGLEEDCVWDPQRIRVVDVISSPNPGTMQQLKDLLQANLNREPGSELESAEHDCGVCKNTMAPPHQLQTCWGCGQTICPFMGSHFCQVHLITMAAYQNLWAEEDGPGFTPATLQSYITPQDGKIYVMYHGTHVNNVNSIRACGFQQSDRGMLGPGVYVSRDKKKASRYPLDVPDHQKVVLKLRVNVGRVIRIDYQGHPRQKTWHGYGYDTAWCPPDCGMVQSGLEEDCVWDPKRIKIVKELRPLRGPDCWAYNDDY
ncbi:GCRV-induced gene 2o [Mustelus asterias]